MLAPVAAVATTDEPYLRLVPVALLIGLAVMFGHQMVRRDGRPRLTESIGITSLGLAVVALGTTWMPLSRTDRASDIALLGFVADRGRVAGRPRRRLREGAAVDASARDAARRRRCAGRRLGGRFARPGARPRSSGSSCAAVSHATRRMLCVLPGVSSVRGQLSTAAASLLVPGVVAYGLALAIVG